ncbi:MAG: helix-turn-helix transcriptional regulator [Oscillospiraceae bacterium]|nr:helix-turn-helix transcriptional regulator [Oscillospiraceae bacterium]
MDDEKLKLQIGKNIAAYRKQAGLTQMGLAEKLNYSDKAVSKWERGESVPDILTLMQLASQFGITVNDLLCDPEALPGNPGTLEKAMTQVSEKALKRKANKNVILALSSTLVWFVALLAFVLLSSFDFLEAYSCLLFFYAIPANCIVLLSLRSAWRDFRWNQMLITGIVWGSLLSIYVTLQVLLHYNFWKIFLLGIPGQIAIFLWFRMFRAPKEKEGDLKNG